MPTAKRRTIWMSDEDWATLNGLAKERNTNVSEVIRSFWGSAHRESVESGYRPGDSLGQPSQPPRPYREFRPAPKPVKKK